MQSLQHVQGLLFPLRLEQYGREIGKMEFFVDNATQFIVARKYCSNEPNN